MYTLVHVPCYAPLRSTYVALQTEPRCDPLATSYQWGRSLAQNALVNVSATKLKSGIMQLDSYPGLNNVGLLAGIYNIVNVYNNSQINET